MGAGRQYVSPLTAEASCGSAFHGRRRVGDHGNDHIRPASAMAWRSEMRRERDSATHGFILFFVKKEITENCLAVLNFTCEK